MSQPPIYTAYKTATATISSTAKSLEDCGFTSAEVAAARNAIVTVRTASVSALWISGVTPTASTGISFPAGGTFAIEGAANIAAAKFIREASADASITVVLEK